jgi:predicted extracellular nuclease
MSFKRVIGMAFRQQLKFIAASLLCCLFLQPALAQSVFINEIHYDNASTDVGEAIEVAGPAGTDLAGWSLVLYNGNGGSSYNTLALSGTLVNQQGGFGTTFVSLPTNGLQNGSPDGIALVDSTNAVVQFLSYEGAFVAADGPANGSTSTDIGVSESSATAAGESLQLTGSGSAYGDFAWATAQPNTFGAVNTGQTFGDGAPGTPMIVINEVDYDQPGSDTAEFIELRNNGSSDVGLDGWSLQLVNGSNNQVYNTIDLGGSTIVGGGHLVICANAATVANCDIDSSPDTNFLQNGAPDAVGLLSNGAIVDAVSYEGSVPGYTEGSGSGLIDAGSNGSISRCPDGTDTDQNNVDLVFTNTSTPGVENVCPSPALNVKIHEVQGSGASSPLADELVVIEGIVIGDFQDDFGPDNGDLNGFFVQEEDADADADPLTSEGIFIFDGSNTAVDVAIGDAVRVEGTVSEFFGMTQITSFSGVTVQSGGNTLPTAAALSLPLTSIDSLEASEGMRVSFAQSLVIAEYFNFDRFGEIVLSSTRLLQPTAEFEPGPDAVAAAQQYALDRITLDDGRTNQNPDPALHPNGAVFDLDNLFRGGDTLQNVTGVLNYSFGLYRVQPTQGADYNNDNPRTPAPDDVVGTLTAASFNVLNYFVTIDDGGSLCGPLLNQGCRGADNDEEFTRQRDKIIAALATIDADVVGLIEIENDSEDAAVANLVDGVNDAVGDDTYSYIETGAIGDDAIRVALIYKPASVSPWGDFAILDSSVDVRFLDDFNRPVLAQSFLDNTTGGIFTVAINHLKSKGSNCNDVGDPDTGDGSGNCNLTREAAAEALVDWLATDPTGSDSDNALILGDLNSYDKEDPIDAIVAGGYIDLVHSFQGEYAYGYVFNGQIGYLDYALASSALNDDVTGTTIWHINADEPDLINYDTSFKRDAQDAIYAPDAYRSSDHDPVIVGLDVCDETPPTIDTLALSKSILWPANHKYVDVSATVEASDNFDPDPTVTLVSVTSNEPDNGEGDGDTINDIVIVDDVSFHLRAERAGGGSGRIYTVTYEATDDCGNSTTASVTATVPHSLGQ